MNIAEIDDIGKTPPMVSFLNGLGAIGLGSPMARIIVGFLAIGGLTYLLQPRFAFDETGFPRPFKLTAPDDPDATLFPWWGPAALTALMFGVFM